MFSFNQITAAMLFHITPVSANVKTGPIPVTTSGRQTCAPDCAFKNNGCYADSGPLAIHWNAVTAGARGIGFAEFCAWLADLEPGALWRHNQAGDLPHVGGLIDHGAIELIIEANHGRRGFTYTHHDMSIPENLAIVELANVAGFTINLSANTPEHADQLADTGLPVVVVLPVDQAENLKTPAGRPIVICPAIAREDVACNTCQLCARADRSVIIGFPAHGTGAKRADSVARGRIIPIFQA